MRQSHRMKGNIFMACVQSVLTYGTETWAMKAENLHSLERAEHMMVRWTCGVSLKDRKQSEVLYSLLGVQSVAKVARHGRLRWFGHVERKSGDDWVSSCRKKCGGGRGEMSGQGYKELERMCKRGHDEHGLQPEWAVFRMCEEASYRGKRLTLAERGRTGRFNPLTVSLPWPTLEVSGVV